MKVMFVWLLIARHCVTGPPIACTVIEHGGPFPTEAECFAAIARMPLRGEPAEFPISCERRPG